MVDYADYVGYTITSTILAGAWVTPLAILWFISLCLAPKRGDPARVGVAWMKAVFPFWIISSIGYTIQGALYVWLATDDTLTSFSFSSMSELTIQQTSAYIGTIAYWFSNIAEILLFVTLVELGSGFSLCLNGGNPTRMRKPNRIAILVVGFILFALSTGYFGLGMSWNVRYYGTSTTNGRELSQDSRTLNRLSGAISILMWITTLPIFWYGIHVVHKAKNHPTLRKSASLFLVATIFNFIRHLFDMALWIHYYLEVVVTVKASEARYPVFYVVSPIFNFLFMFILLVLLFTLAIRKPHNGGLWSVAHQEQVWAAPGTYPGPAMAYNNGMAPAYAPAYAPGGAPAYPAAAAGQYPVAQQGTGPMPAYLVVAQEKERERQGQPVQQA